MCKKLILRIFYSLILFLFLSGNQLNSQSLKNEKTMFQPRSYEQADKMADSVLVLMTLEEKIALVGGDRGFFIRPLPRLNLPEVYMADATQGVHLRDSFRDADLADYQLEKSTAFPCPLALTATWNPDMAYQYAEAIGEECRAANIGFLLGPGMNSYRQSQCGRNFEYFGEDPFLAARMIDQYVRGVQSTGTVATLKHFVANNTDYYRRKSNSVVDERALHEIYLPAFKAGVDAGARAVMTSYNLLDGEWCGQSEAVINGILRKQLGFKWLVMTDWWSVEDGEQLAQSGQDLEMPQSVALESAGQLIREGKVRVEDIDRMVKSILRTCFAMKFAEREKAPVAAAMFDRHESIALQTAREAIVLLKNVDDVLPVKNDVKKILLTGDYVKVLAMGGGAARVEGFNKRLMLDELKREFGARLKYVENPSIRQIKSADLVLCNIGTSDSEGWDRSFELPADQEKKVRKCVKNNPNTVVIVTSGSGVRMTDWNEKAKAIVYAWYGGQTGNRALAEIIAGKVNPSGKLPISIEKDFRDSPGYGYIPEGEMLYSDWDGEGEKAHPVYDVVYKEGVFTGYRWYEKKKITPLYAFGHGLSYTRFEYSDLQVSEEKFTQDDIVTVSFVVKNVGKAAGMETAQLYVQDVESSAPRPVKELKAFQKIELKPGESKTVTLKLCKKAYSFWNPEIGDWCAEKGKFIIHIGTSSGDIRLKKEIELI